MVLEDVVLLARLIGRYGAADLREVFSSYEGLRRERIEDAYNEASFR